MKGRDFVQYGAGLAASTLYNYFSNPRSTDPGTQLQAYRDMKFYMKGRHASRTRTVVKKRRKNRRGGGSIGAVLGPPIPKTGAVASRSKYCKYGSFGQDETFGTMTRGEMCYIGVTSAKATGSGGEAGNVASWSGSITYHVAAALLRTILKREFREDICRHDQLISANPLGGATNSSGRYPVIVFVSRKDTLTGGPPEYTSKRIYLGSYSSTVPIFSGGSGGAANPRMFGTVAQEICEQIIGGTEFGGVVGADAFTHSLYGYYIIEPDAAVLAVGLGGTADNRTVEGHTSGIRRLDNQYLCAYSTAEIALQNITIADATSDASGVRLDNRIDANPLDCAVYKFTTPYPKVRSDGFNVRPGPTWPGVGIDTGPAGNASNTDWVPDSSFVLQYDENADGVIVPTAELSRDWRQIPLPDKFYGCTGFAKFKLEPGQIRKGTLKFKFEGSLNNFIKGFKTIEGADSSRYNGNDAFGTSMLFAMEKVMSTGTNNDVTINYQVSYWAGAYMKRQKGEVMQSYNHSATHVPGAVGGFGVYTAGTYTGAADVIS